MKAKALSAAQAALIVFATAWVYTPAIHGGWVWDDVIEIPADPSIQGSAAGLAKVWFAPATPDYFPLKTTVQWVEWHLWGADPAGYHLVSLALHVSSALLFWRLLRKLFVQEGAPTGAAGWSAWLGGLLFAVHPLAVESVAWISELKNALSLPLLLLAMIAWAKYDGGRRPPGAGEQAESICLVRDPRNGARVCRPEVGSHHGEDRRPPGSRSTATSRHYLLALFWFLLAMLAKSSVVMFPVVLLLYAWWRRGRIGRSDLRDTAAFFAVSLALGLVTVWFQQHRTDAGVHLGLGSWESRLAAAGLAIAFYAGKFVAPVGLLPIYPQWRVQPPAWPQFWPWLALAVLAGALWARRDGRGRHALFGLGFFLVNLAPVLGFVPMAFLHYSGVSDHLVYLPMLGLAGLAASGVLACRRRAAPLAPVFGLLVAAAAIQAHRYASVFRSNEGFWAYAARGNPGAWIAYNNLGNALTSAGRPADAIPDFERALSLRPDYAEADYNLGSALADLSRLPEAISAYREALRLDPGLVEAHMNLGNALAQTGRLPEAMVQYKAALRLRPDYADAHYNFGNALVLAGRYGAAAEQYEATLRLRPGDPAARDHLTRLRALEETLRRGAQSP